MNHSYETNPQEIQSSLTEFKVAFQSDSKVTLSFSFKISEKSQIQQDIVFYSYSPKIDFKSNVDWYETKKVLKAYFPVDINTDYATFEIGSGLVKRPIHTNTSWD